MASEVANIANLSVVAMFHFHMQSCTTFAFECPFADCTVKHLFYKNVFDIHLHVTNIMSFDKIL